MKLRAAFCCLALVTLSACGGDSSSSTSATSYTKDSKSAKKVADVKPCELVTKDEAQSAYGAALNDGTPSNGSPPACVFGSSDLKRLSDNVQVQVQETYIFDGTKSAAATGTQGAFKIDNVNGIGDDAFYQSSEGASGAARLILLGFKKSGVAVYVSVSNKDMSDDQIKSAERQLAEKVASRL